MNNKVFVSFEVEDVSDEQIENNVIRNALSVLDHLGVHDAELSCSFVSDNTIRQLNKEYRDKDEATDVLSFPQEEKIAGQANWPAILIEGEQPVPRILGDLVISMESVKRNCVTFDVQCDEEVDSICWDKTTLPTMLMSRCCFFRNRCCGRYGRNRPIEIFRKTATVRRQTW